MMMKHPSTYRIQFNAEFPFQKLGQYLEYLDNLGISTIYASPVMQSVAGSMHGYDVTDPNRIDPELGGNKALHDLLYKVKSRKMGWLQDIVPNHMAFNLQNRKMMEVLEEGPGGSAARYFDIDWSHPVFGSRLMVPFLGKPLDEVLHARELNLVFKNGWFFFNYFENLYPINQRSFYNLAGRSPDQWPREVKELMIGKQEDSWHLAPDREDIQYVLDQASGKHPGVRTWVEDLLSRVNGSPHQLRELLDLQHYVLTEWKRSEKEINYRRFFTVNSLICLRMEDPEVFDAHHLELRHLFMDGLITGFRIDHIDGLWDPAGYLLKLREMAGPDTWILVEKILEPEEKIPAAWPAEGTTGYDFMAYVSNLFTNQRNYPRLESFYREYTGIDEKLEDIIYEKKHFILTQRMGGELENLLHLFMAIHGVSEKWSDINDLERLKEALSTWMVCLPVYRIYPEAIPLAGSDAGLMRDVFKNAKRKNPDLRNELEYFRALLLDNAVRKKEEKSAILDFFRRCMQFTGPLMAKGVEDTTMYYYNCFVVHNEVGDDPGSNGLSAGQFHEQMILRQKLWPEAMNSTSTHDTKRGEDVRARLNVISDIPEAWILAVAHWSTLNAPLRSNSDGKVSPTPNEEYLIYQTLAGIWPMGGEPGPDFGDRVKEYLIKAMREAKVHTSWNDPNEFHEKKVIGFLEGLLDPGHDFLLSFRDFTGKILIPGILNSLSQLILKITCPGIPDIYQGTEFWDLSLVDPDNRRPVDYDDRKKRLEMILAKTRKAHGPVWQELISALPDPGIKLWCTYVLLQERKAYPNLLTGGDYLPLETEGKYADHIMGYIRHSGDQCMIIMVPLHVAALKDESDRLPSRIDWADTALKIPYEFRGEYLDVFRRKQEKIGETVIVQGLDDPLPLGVWRLT